MNVRWLLVVPLLVGLVQPAPAGILFGRKKKPTPNERVPELVNILRSDKDEDHRTRAAEELRQYDGAAFPDIIPTLVEVLRSDSKPAVRTEAAVSLGKLRPVSEPAGQALEQALATDPSMRVRLQARSALLQYHWAGYHGPRKGDTPPLGTGKEPPIADPGKFPPAVTTGRPGSPQRLGPTPSAPPRFDAGADFRAAPRATGRQSSRADAEARFHAENHPPTHQYDPRGTRFAGHTDAFALGTARGNAPG